MIQMARSIAGADMVAENYKLMFNMCVRNDTRTHMTLVTLPSRSPYRLAVYAARTFWRLMPHIVVRVFVNRTICERTRGIHKPYKRN